MAASTIYFNGRIISIPGSYSSVDASGLAAVNLGASGIVALIGTSIGGKPWNEVDTGDTKGNLQTATRPRQPLDYFRSGDLREGAALMFNPSVDDDIPGGPQEIVFVKVNPATQSSAGFDNSDGEALVLTSGDYGYFTTQINVEIATGTSQGKMITITFETTEEVFDDVGGDTVFELTYLASTPADGFTTITGEIKSGELECLFTRDQTGLDGDVSNQVTPGQVIELVSSSGSDTAVQVRLYGTNTSDLVQTATYTLDGTNVIDTTETWNSFHGAEIVAGTLVGTLTIQNDAAASTIATIAPAGTEAAIEFTVDHPVSLSALYFEADAADTSRVTIFGLNSAGVFQTEMVQLAGTTPVASGTAALGQNCTFTNGSTNVPTAGDLTGEVSAGDYVYLTADTIAAATRVLSITAAAITLADPYPGAGGAAGASTVWTQPIKWSRIDGLALGELPAARTLTVNGEALSMMFAGLDTVQKLADKANGTAGFTLTVVITNPTRYASTDLDYQGAVDIKSTAKMTALGDLAAIVTKLNNESTLVTAAKGSVASGPPDNTTAAVYLAGGHEGSSTPGQEGVPTALTADWQGAIDLLTKVRVNTVVALTSDTAIHAYLKNHCQYMAGAGKSERDCIVGMENAGQTDVPTKTEAKAQIADLNSRHVRAVAQTIEQYNTGSSGESEREEFTTPFTACVLAGAQAGSPVGTSLTWKYMNVLKLRQDSSWNPVDDAEELIQAGLCMMEVVDGVGRRVVRNVTTHLIDSNMAYTEASVNEAVNYSVYNFRTTMEEMVGQSGFAGSANAAKGLAVNILGLMVGVSLVAWQSLDVQLVLDVLEVAAQIAPVLPINFVTSTLHLVTIPQSAAA